MIETDWICGNCFIKRSFFWYNNIFNVKVYSSILIICLILLLDSTQIWQNPFEGYVRLIGPSQSAGELLVYLKGQWGAVCADNFTKAEADSVCRQLGYTDSNGHQPTRQAVVGDLSSCCYKVQITIISLLYGMRTA